MIDFDEPVHHWLASDVARPFRELDPRAENACLEAFLDGYREKRAFDSGWEPTLPGFVRMKSLEIYVWASLPGGWEDSDLPGGRPRDAELEQIRSRFGRIDRW